MAEKPDKQQRLLQLIECPVCLNELQDPRMLSCRHALCYTCVKDYTEKNKYDKELPCPVCRLETPLGRGGVNNLPTFFFINELKEIMMGDDTEVRPSRKVEDKGVVCCTGDCGEQASQFCTKGCDFLCEVCHAEHTGARVTKNHKVIKASEAEAFTNKSPYPPCHRHQHQLVDLYCRTCQLPVCNTCSNSSHRGHDCCELEEQAEVCKSKLEHMCEHTDVMIDQLKLAIDKTKCQTQQAETDIDEMCNNVRSTFKVMHDKLGHKEKEMLADLQEARRRLKKTTDVIADSQIMTLSNLECVKSCQSKLTTKNSSYDYVTVTDSDNMVSPTSEVPGFLWNYQLMEDSDTGFVGQVTLTETQLTQEDGGGKADMEEIVKVKEMGKMQVEVQDTLGVLGMVVYKQNIYIVNHIGLIVYRYTPEGSLSQVFKHKGGEKTDVQGMCLMISMHGKAKAMLVVSDHDKQALVWINISDDFTLNLHRTQQVGYKPCGSYNDRGDLLVRDHLDHKIHHYDRDGQPLNIITLTDDIMPLRVTRGSNQYIITDWRNTKAAIIENSGQVKKVFRDDIQGMRLTQPYDVVTDLKGRTLISDCSEHPVILTSKELDVSRQLLEAENVRKPMSMCLDDQNNKLYVAGEDTSGVVNVFVYHYNLLTNNNHDNTITSKITRLDLTVRL